MKKYNLEQDHKQIKEQIKKWELELDRIWHEMKKEYFTRDIQDKLEAISQEMMSINI